MYSILTIKIYKQWEQEVAAVAVVVAGVAWVAWHVVLIAMHISELAKSEKYSFWPYIESEDSNSEKPKK